MKVSFVGYEGKGAWQIRAKQIAPFLNAGLDPNLLKPNKCEAVIVIKMPGPHLLNRIRKFNLPLIWDPQDCWPQTEILNMNNADRASMLQWLDSSLKIVAPKIVIAATSKMQEDISGLGYKSIVIHHHHRPNIKINEIRKDLNIVGVEGTPKQLVNWPQRLKNICKTLGLTFSANLEATKDKLHTFDILVAVREHVGYAAKNWKSNVKLANAHGSGTPGIFAREQGYMDTATGLELWSEDEEQIIESILKLKSYDLRKSISDQFLKHKKSAEQIAEDYKALIDSL